MSRPPLWSDTRVAELKRLWDSAAPGAEIAASLGVTQGALFAKVHRLGLTPRHGNTFQWPGRPRVRPWTPPEPAAPLAPKVWTAPDVTTTMSLRHARVTLAKAAEELGCTRAQAALALDYIGRMNAEEFLEVMNGRVRR